LENILIMVLTIVTLLVGAFLLLLILHWGLKLKSGRREKEGLAMLWAGATKPFPGEQDCADDPLDIAEKPSTGIPPRNSSE
jgi:hypothetical protein